MLNGRGLKMKSRPSKSFIAAVLIAMSSNALASPDLYLQCNINRSYSKDDGYFPNTFHEYFKIDFDKKYIEKYNDLPQKYQNFCKFDEEMKKNSGIRCEIDDEIFHFSEISDGTGNEITIYRTSGVIFDEYKARGAVFLGSYGTCFPGQNIETSTRKF